MKKAAAGLVAGLFLVFLPLLTGGAAASSHSPGCTPCPGKDENALFFRRIAGGSYSGVVERRFSFVTSPEGWERAWREANGAVMPQPSLPAVDFQKESVALVFQGRKRSGGYGVEVTSVLEREGFILVVVGEREPLPGAVVTAAISSPWDAVAFPAAGKPVFFVPSK